MTEHAPAPWSYEASGKPGGNGDFNIYVIDKNKRKIAAVWGKRGEKEATAAVLMAAPGLLELLKIAVCDHNDHFGKSTSKTHWTNKALEIIALADGRSIVVNYLSLGSVPASSDTFGGSLILKPDVPSAGALGFGENVIEGLKKKVGYTEGKEIIDERTDTIEFSNFSTPSSGLPSDKGCGWRGSAVYAYQTSSWFLKLEGDCSGKKYVLTGNMPWVDTEDGNARYDLTLTLPSQAVSSDAALFADATNNDALFATADGISGTITMKLGSPVTVQVDGKPEDVPSSIDASGTLTGQNVPVEVVRSLATVMAVLSRTFFGA